MKAPFMDALKSSDMGNPSKRHCFGQCILKFTLCGEISGPCKEYCSLRSRDELVRVLEGNRQEEQEQGPLGKWHKGRPIIIWSQIVKILYHVLIPPREHLPQKGHPTTK